MDNLPADFPVSRETRRRLEVFVGELLRWQDSINLVSPRSLPQLWRRHIADALQLPHLAPGARRWLDLGSGAGLPGIVIAASESLPKVTLIESDSRKCAFLRHVRHLLDLDVEIVEDRIERAGADRVSSPDVVTARGLAKLDTLLGYACDPLTRGAIGLFPKGKTFAAELTEARESWTFDVDLAVSRTDPEARILRVTGLQLRPAEERRDGER